MVDFLPMDGPGYPEPNSVLWYRGPTIGNRWLSLEESTSLLGLNVFNRIVTTAVPFEFENDGTAISDLKFSALQTFMDTIGSTSFGATVPPATARALQWPGGRFVPETPQILTTWGSGATMFGDGPATVLEDIGFSVTEFRANINDLTLYSQNVVPGTFGLDFNGDGRRFSNASRIVIVGKDIGVRYRGIGAFDQWDHYTISGCRVGLRVERTLGIVGGIGEIIGCTDFGMEIISDGEFKADNMIIRGSGKANLYIHGSGRRPVVEHYFNLLTLTGAVTRTKPLLSYTDAGGFVRFVVAEKIACDVDDYDSILTGGDAENPASAYVQLAGSGGQIDTLTVDGVAIISAPVVWAGTLNDTADALTDAINAGTLTHGYTSMNTNQFVYVDSAIPGAAFNGLVIVTTSSGGLTATTRLFVSVTTATPHNLTVGFLQMAEVDAAPYAGIALVRYVIDANTFITDAPHEGPASGQMWIPHLFVKQLSQVRLVGSGGLNTLLNLTASDDVSVTTDLVFADFAAPPVGAVLSVPGWDLVYDTDDVNNARTTDLMVGAMSNINYALILSGLNCMFGDVRAKCQMQIATRMNTNLQAAGVHFRFPARGRFEDTNSGVLPSGCNTGWTLAGPNMGGSSSPGVGYYSIVTPNDELPLVDGFSQNNETRWYQDRIEFYIGGELVMTLDEDIATFLAGKFVRPNGQIAVNTIEIRSGPSGGSTHVRVVGETGASLSFELPGDGAYDFFSDQGTTPTRQFRVLRAANAVNYLQVVGSATGAGPNMSAAGDDANIDIRLTPKGTGVLRFGVNTPLAAETLTSYVTIRDAAGTLRKVGVVS